MWAIPPFELNGTAGNLDGLPARSAPSVGLATAQDGIAIDFVPRPIPGVRWLRWRRRRGVHQLGIFFVADHPFRHQQLYHLHEVHAWPSWRRGVPLGWHPSLITRPNH